MNRLLASCYVLCFMFGHAAAQTDPVIMTINGQPVQRSEFEYSYNKNNSDGVIDKKTIEEYVDLFINYKLKVAAALDEHLDTLTSFKQEFAQYRDQQVRPTLVTEEDVTAEAHKIYDQTKEQIGPRGLIRPAHIFLSLSQSAPKDVQDKTKQRIDSIYAALQKGADFGELARKLSQDHTSGPNGGLMPWIGPNQVFEEFENAAYALETGQTSQPVLSPAGWHIIQLQGRKQLEPFDSLKANIYRFIEQRGLRERIAEQKLNAIVEASNGKLTAEQVMDQRSDSLSAIDDEMKNLIREYHDGLLLYEISNRMVWDKAAKDEAGLASYFKKNKKKYNWDVPRFKGIAYHVKDQADVKAVVACVKKLPFDQWADALRHTFNPDSVIRIRVEKGIFKEGDNALIDREAFKKDTTVTAVKDYPIDAVYGKMLKKGPEEYTDVRGLVTADYQDQLEREWVAELRRKYTFEVNKDVLKTVNNH